MRKSRVIAVAIASLVSSASFAQAQSAAPGTRAARQEMREERGERGQGGALRGIKLSDAEKDQLKAIRSKYASENKSLRESLRPAMQEARAARQKGDTAAARAAFERSKGDREHMKAVRDREQAEIRAALSPEHQKLFDANVARAKERREDWAKKGGKHRKGDRDDRREGTNG